MGHCSFPLKHLGLATVGRQDSGLAIGLTQRGRSSLLRGNVGRETGSEEDPGGGGDEPGKIARTMRWGEESGRPAEWRGKAGS